MKQKAAIAVLAMAALTAGCGSNSKNASDTTTSSDVSIATTSTVAASSSTAASSATTASTAASSSTTASKSNTTQKPTTVKVTKADNGKKQTLHVGSSIEVRLEECGGCGYEWRVTTHPKAAVLKESGSTVDSTTSSTKAGTPPIVGQPTYYVYSYKAVGVGSTTVVIKNYGPGGSATETFTMPVQVLA